MGSRSRGPREKIRPGSGQDQGGSEVKDGNAEGTNADVGVKAKGTNN